MKKLIALLSAIALMFTITSCEDLLNITFEDVPFESQLDIPLLDNIGSKSISLVGEDMTKTFNDSIIINVSDAGESSNDQEQLSDYLESLSSMEITLIQYTILAFEGSIFSLDEFHVIITDNEGNIYLEQTLENVQPNLATVLNLANANLSGAQDILTSNKDLKIKFSGSVTGDATSFSIAQYILANITANAANGLGL